VTNTNLIYDILLSKGPLISADIQKELIEYHEHTRDSARKYIQRTKEKGIIKEYIRISNKGFIYYIENLHDRKTLLNYSLRCFKDNNCRIYSIIEILKDANILIYEEIGRLLNIHNKTFLNNIIENLKLVGFICKDNYVLNLNDKLETLIYTYNNKMLEESDILKKAITYIENNNVDINITNYRKNMKRTKYFGKFDAVGKMGRKKVVSIVIDCQCRREVKIQDLIGFKNRRGSSIGKKSITMPIISYFISTNFSDECIDYSKKNNIRLLKYDGNNFIKILSEFETIRKNIKSGGRLSEIKGSQFETWVELSYKNRHFITNTRKYFYIDNNNEITKKTSKRYVDIDVYASNNDYINLIECKSSPNQITRKELIEIVEKYDKVAKYLIYTNHIKNINIVIICNHNKYDAKDVKKRSNFDILIIKPEQFFKQNKRYLRNAPKWLFKE